MVSVIVANQLFFSVNQSHVSTVGLDNYNHTEAINIVPPSCIISSNQKQQQQLQDNDKYHNDSNAGVGKESPCLLFIEKIKF